MSGLQDARAELADLCAHPPVWTTDPARRVGTSARRSAVLVLFGVLDAHPAHAAHPAVARDLDVLLTRRSPTVGHHPGQIAFPGGGIDATDAGPEAAALREAVEETGLDPKGVDVLGTLPELHVPVSNNLVTPVPAWWSSPSPVVAADRAETAGVFRAPVADLLDPTRRRTATVRAGLRVYRSPAFLVDEHVVWGFTAGVLDRIFEALGWTEPWDVTRTIPAPL